MNIRPENQALSLTEKEGFRVVEGLPDRPLVSDIHGAALIVEACLSGRVNCALLYPRNLTGRFFDLSSGEAGAILEKLRNYRIRLAVVCAPGSVRPSHRFGEMLAEEGMRRHFRVFESRDEALSWLMRG